MKNDSDDHVRVTVTFRRESNPAWYSRLKNISSGRDRAEVLRKHLSPPHLEASIPFQETKAMGDIVSYAPMASAASHENRADARREATESDVSALQANGYSRTEFPGPASRFEPETTQNKQHSINASEGKEALPELVQSNKERMGEATDLSQEEEVIIETVALEDADTAEGIPSAPRGRSGMAALLGRPP